MRRPAIFYCIFAYLLCVIPIAGHGFQGFDLTGMWQDDLDGRYKIRQIGSTVVWLDDRMPTVANVFTGTISGSTISGQWVDLPGGQLQTSGSLTLRIESNDRIVKVSTNITYGGSVITRTGGSGQSLPLIGGAWSDAGQAASISQDPKRSL